MVLVIGAVMLCPRVSGSLGAGWHVTKGSEPEGCGQRGLDRVYGSRRRSPAVGLLIPSIGGPDGPLANHGCTKCGDGLYWRKAVLRGVGGQGRRRH